MRGLTLDRKLWAAAAALFIGSLLVLAICGGRTSDTVSASSALQLRTADLGDRLRVQWNPLAPAVSRAESATLEVNDGGKLNRYPVDANVLHSGKLDYLRQSNDIVLSLILQDQGKPSTVGVVRAVRQQPPEKVETAAVQPRAAADTGQRARRVALPRTRHRW